MFTNRDSTEIFGNEISKKLDNFDSFEVTTGYFGSEIIERLEKKLIKIAERGYCKILIGMIFHSSVSKKQKKTLEDINKKLRKINSQSGIYILRQDYHGKIYRFQNNQEKLIYIGSSNFSNEGLNKRLECNIPIIDTENKSKVSNFIDYLFNHKDTVNLEDVELRLKKQKRKKIRKTLKDYQRRENLFPKMKHISETVISLRPDRQPRSSLNLCFDKGRKVTKNGKEKWIPRDWYEVEITTQKKEHTKDYPRGEFKAWVKDNGKFYELDMITSGGDIPSKNIKGYKDIMTRERAILGELIKGKLQRLGYLEENDAVKLDTLQSYGIDYISLKKIKDKVYYLEF
jgi:hypothetical protein|tara:strand:- start:43 stop:1071 length:1029 start_codon:yes stop_codon:yes gene_type:complete